MITSLSRISYFDSSLVKKKGHFPKGLPLWQPLSKGVAIS